MSDVQFRLHSMTKSFADHTARLCVLKPIALPDIAKPTHVQWAQGFQDALRRWRLRVDELKEHHWSPGNVYGLRNCWPAMFMVGSQSVYQACKHGGVCPWCYARDVSRVYRRIRAARQPGQEIWGLYRVVAEPSTKSARAAIYHYLRQVSKTVTMWRDTWRHKSSCTGAIWKITIEPQREAGDPWLIKQRVVVLRSSDDDALDYVSARPDAKDILKIVSRYPEVSNKNILNTLTRVWRYPLGMLYGDPSLAVQTLEMRDKSFRFSGVTGSLRQKFDAAKDDEKQIQLHFQQIDEANP